MGTKIKDLAASSVAPKDLDYVIIDVEDGAGGYDTKKISMPLFGQSTGVWTTVLIPTAQVLTLNTIPVELIPALGVGIVAIPTSVIVSATYAGVAYATNIKLDAIYSGAAKALFSQSGVLDFATTITQELLRNNQNKAIEYIANTAFMLQVSTGDPTLGTSDLTVYTHYTILTQ